MSALNTKGIIIRLKLGSLGWVLLPLLSCVLTFGPGLLLPFQPQEKKMGNEKGPVSFKKAKASPVFSPVFHWLELCHMTFAFTSHWPESFRG